MFLTEDETKQSVEAINQSYLIHSGSLLTQTHGIENVFCVGVYNNPNKLSERYPRSNRDLFNDISSDIRAVAVNIFVLNFLTYRVG